MHTLLALWYQAHIYLEKIILPVYVLCIQPVYVEYLWAICKEHYALKVTKMMGLFFLNILQYRVINILVRKYSRWLLLVSLFGRGGRGKAIMDQTVVFCEVGIVGFFIDEDIKTVPVLVTGCIRTWGHISITAFCLLQPSFPYSK